MGSMRRGLWLGCALVFAVASRTAQGAVAPPSLSQLVDSVKASVVNVEVESRVGADESSGEEFFDFFFGGPGQRGHPAVPKPQYRQGAGSGFIIDPKGLVVTNNHVVEGAITIRIKLDDGREFDAEVLGRDPLTDVALVKLKGRVENLPVAKFGDSDAIKVGDWVIAIGNPFGLASSVSAGIISARARDIHAGPYDDFLQTDAAINPGNSGGPLFNMNGEVIGMNTAIVGGGTGIGFAVPSNVIKRIVPQLEEKGSVTRGWIGVYVEDLNADLAKGLRIPVSKGAVVTQVQPDSPAAKAGLRQDDVIVAMDGQALESASMLTRTVAWKAPGSRVKLTVFREGKRQDVTVELGKRPDLENKSEEQQPPAENEVGHRLGLALQDVAPDYARSAGVPPQGALITDVQPGSPAEHAQLQAGMVVVEANNQPVHSAQELARILRKVHSGNVVLLRVAVPGGEAKILRALRVP